MQAPLANQVNLLGLLRMTSDLHLNAWYAKNALHWLSFSMKNIHIFGGKKVVATVNGMSLYEKYNVVGYHSWNTFPNKFLKSEILL